MRSREDIIKRVKESEKNALQATKNKRQSDWLAIQQKTPEIANFMKSYHSVFGKPGSVKIYINNELFLEV